MAHRSAFHPDQRRHLRMQTKQTFCWTQILITIITALQQKTKWKPFRTALMFFTLCLPGPSTMSVRPFRSPLTTFDHNKIERTQECGWLYGFHTTAYVLESLPWWRCLPLLRTPFNPHADIAALQLMPLKMSKCVVQSGMVQSILPPSKSSASQKGEVCSVLLLIFQ